VEAERAKGRGCRARLDDFHVNGDGTLCLGSRIRVMTRLQSEPTVPGLSKNCIVPTCMRWA